MDVTKRKMISECYHCANKQEVPGNCHITCVKPDADMTGDEHGIRSGWFFYPLLFDPTWKTKMCNNYEANKLVKTVVSNSISVAGESK